ncbi:MAG: D-aminoacyl-tRNA deacylase [Candidatus Halalkalibacterium sp. M3_1C_030]
MKVVLQRAKNASVTVDEKQVGAISSGLVLLVGIHEEDTEDEMQWISEKILKMRIFDDKDGKMNLSVEDVGGELLVISQFTLYGDASKGNRPSYIEAAGPEKAQKLYEQMIDYFKDNSGLKVESGTFGAYMDVKLTNDGPVTIVLEK